MAMVSMRHRRLERETVHGTMIIPITQVYMVRS